MGPEKHSCSEKKWIALLIFITPSPHVTSVLVPEKPCYAKIVLVHNKVRINAHNKVQNKVQKPC